MPTNASVNVPSGEQLLRLIRGVLAHDALISPAILAPWRPRLGAVRDRLDQAISPRVRERGYAAARELTAARDAALDDLQRYLYGLFDALRYAPNSEVAAAARLAQATLYPDKLAVVIASYADEAAAGPTFEKKLALPDVGAALATLGQVVVDIAAIGQAVVQAAAALGEALAAQDALFAAEAGAAASELFTARVEAHQQFALFTQIVSVAAYPDESPEHRAARAALIGPYRRYLNAGVQSTTKVPDPALATTPTVAG